MDTCKYEHSYITAMSTQFLDEHCGEKQEKESELNWLKLAGHVKGMNRKRRLGRK
jgi:hypothetical protein